MGKHKKRDRENSQGNSRSRSRSKDRDRSHSQQSEGLVKPTASYYKHLNQYRHQFYLENQSKTVSLPYVIWNLCVKIVSRPSVILVICQSMDHLMTIQRACRLQRLVKIIDESQHSRSISDLIQEKVEVILTTQKKCSMMMAVEEERKVFDGIINASFCFDHEFYGKICELAKQAAKIINFAIKASSIKSLSDHIGINFEETESTPTEFQLQRQLVADVQLASKPTPETLALVKNMGFSSEEAAARLIQLEKKRRQLPKSLHLGMTGYITYRLNMDVQFNSLKYAWNFLREQFPRDLYREVKGLHKYENEKGVVMNIPQEFKYQAETVAQKFRKRKSKYNGIELKQCLILPRLEDTESEEFKIMRQKKKHAMQNKHELQIFIGGIPYEMQEEDLRSLFKQNGVNLFLVRVLKDQKGFSKGIGFGLCENKEHFVKAMQLNGTRYMDRTIRVKLADQRKS